MKKEIKVAIIGLGYVGLPLARLFATKYPVVGFDINENRIAELHKGIDSTLEIDSDTLSEVIVKELKGNGLFLTSEVKEVKKSFDEIMNKQA